MHAGIMLTEEPMSNATTILNVAAEELVRQATAIAGDLPDQYLERAKKIAENAKDLGAAYVAGTISKDDLKEATEDLLLSARSTAAMAGLDVWSKREEAARGAAAVLVKVALAAMA